jgi:hypothetical protein
MFNNGLALRSKFRCGRFARFMASNFRREQPLELSSLCGRKGPRFRPGSTGREPLQQNGFG